ncbi:MAG: hypothetical protein Q8O99_00695 [bacterium]|nr:hypothetical protein [bacterium]
MTAEEYGYFQARLDLPEQVKKDLKEVGKQYGKGKTGKEYVSMKLLTVLKGYQDTLPEIEKALVGLQVKTFLDIIYPEILKNSWSHEAYRQQRVTFFQKKYHPTFQRNVDIGKSNQEFSRLVAQANRVALENWPKYLTYYPKINMDCFTDPQLVKKYAGQKLLDLDNEVIVSSSQTGKKTRTRNHVYREGVIPSETVKVAVG